MKHTVTKLIFLYLLILIAALPSLAALEFSFSSASSAEANENISISIISQEAEEIFDIKIFVQNQEGKVISEVYNENAWKSGFYYIKSSFPAVRNYTIRVKSEGDWQLCVRLRKAGKTTFFEKCSSISISPDSSPQSNPDSTNDENEEDGQESNNPSSDNSSQSQQASNASQSNLSLLSSKTSEKTSPEYAPALSQKIPKNSSNQPSDSGFSSEKITLSSKNLSPGQSQVYSSKENNVRLAFLYAFAFLAFIIIIFLAFRKI